MELQLVRDPSRSHICAIPSYIPRRGEDPSEVALEAGGRHRPYRGEAEGAASEPPQADAGSPRRLGQSRVMLGGIARNFDAGVLMNAFPERPILAESICCPKVTDKLLDTCPEELPLEIPASPEVAQQAPNSCPKAAEQLSNSGRRSRDCPNSNQIGRCGPQFGRFGTNLARFQTNLDSPRSAWGKCGQNVRQTLSPKLAKLGRIWSDLAQGDHLLWISFKFGRTSAKFGPNWPTCGSKRPTCAEIGPLHRRRHRRRHRPQHGYRHRCHRRCHRRHRRGRRPRRPRYLRH